MKPNWLLMMLPAVLVPALATLGADAMPRVFPTGVDRSPKSTIRCAPIP